MIDFGYNNKKTNIKVNILLSAFLENEFHNNEVCINEINKSFKESIGIWVSIYNITGSIYCPVIHINHDDKYTVIHLDKIKFNNKTICFKTGLKIILAYICYLASDNKHSAYNIVEHKSPYMKAINQIIDKCEEFDIDLEAKYNEYHATIDCYFSDLIESILI